MTADDASDGLGSTRVVVPVDDLDDDEATFDGPVPVLPTDELEPGLIDLSE